MGAVADTSLKALALETRRLRYPMWLQQRLFFRKAKGTHGVHSPLAYQLATEVFTKPDAAPVATRLQEQFGAIFFQTAIITDLPEALDLLAQYDKGALWVEAILADRPRWLTACADARVTLAIDCFESGLLLRTPEIKEKQYLRQRCRN